MVNSGQIGGYEKEGGPANRTGPMELTPLRITPAAEGEAFSIY
jgi:hypothetical protein